MMNLKRIFFCCIFILALPAIPNLRAQTGNISGSPNPCEIYLIQNTCTVTITWSSQATTLVEVWVSSTSGEKLFARTGTGGPFHLDAPWIQDRDYTFSLYDYSAGSRGALLGAATVRGERSLRCEPLQ